MKNKLGVERCTEALRKQYQILTTEITQKIKYNLRRKLLSVRETLYQGFTTFPPKPLKYFVLTSYPLQFTTNNQLSNVYKRITFFDK